MGNNRENYTKAKAETIEPEEMDNLLREWGIEPVNEKTATPDFVPAQIIDKNKDGKEQDIPEKDEELELE